ncbi:hypothetical protein STENM327S_02085 [Streptomyces tendae]
MPGLVPAVVPGLGSAVVPGSTAVSRPGVPVVSGIASALLRSALAERPRVGRVGGGGRFAGFRAGAAAARRAMAARAYQGL